MENHVDRCVGAQETRFLVEFGGASGDGDASDEGF